MNDRPATGSSRFQWERYTERARSVVAMAQEEAKTLNHDVIAPIHLLLGVLGEREGTSVSVLAELGVTTERVRSEAIRTMGRGTAVSSGRLLLTERGENVLKSALRDSEAQNVSYLGTEHILLALLGDDETARSLSRLGAEPVRIRMRTLEETGRARRARVFLCHSSADKPAVRTLYRQLDMDGLAPWLDEEDLLPGVDWDHAIRSAVRKSDFVAVCLSSASTTSAGYVHKEIKEALDVADEQPEGTIFVIPVRLEECAVPSRLSHLHWVDLFVDGGYPRLLRALGTRPAA